MKERLLAAVRRADGYQRRRDWLGLPYAVIRKFSEDRASNLAALISYYAFFSIFPLILAATTILGYVLTGHPDLQKKVQHSWLSQIPLIGSSLGKNQSLTGNAAALIVGLVLALWSGLAVARTAQTAFNSVYNIPMADRPNVVEKTKRAVVLMLVVGIGLIVSTGLSGVVTGTSSTLGIAAKIGSAIVAIAINIGIFAVAFNWLTVRDITWREALPGATFSAVAWYALQLGSTAVVTHKLHGAQGTYGQFAIVIVLLSWFYLAAQLVLLGAELNVVLSDRLWPRALLDRPQTDADFRAFEAYAEEQRYTPLEDVDTQFDDADVQQGRDEVLGDR